MILEILGTILLFIGGIFVVAQKRYNNGQSKYSQKKHGSN